MVFHLIKEKYERYERHLSSIAIATGFVFDNIFLKDVDALIDHVLYILYFLIVAGAIALVNCIESGVLRSNFWKKSHSWLLTIMHFCSGGFFSGFIILYGQSTFFFSNGVFFLLLIAFFICNEFIKKHYARLTLHVSVFYAALFGYLIFLIPLLLRRLGADAFILSGIVSLILMIAFLWWLRRLVPTRFAQSRRSIIISIAAIYLGLNVFYFGNLIPPIPLSVRSAGVYHSLVKNPDGSYTVTAEPTHWYSFIFPFPSEYIVKGDPLYVVSSVFAPTAFTADIVHEWKHYDAAKSAWVSAGKIEFPITGGRDGGFRGYSRKTNLTPGLWRVDIETVRGETIGQVKFRVIEVEKQPALEIQTQ